MELVETWHDSIDFIEVVNGHTRLNGDQLIKLHSAIILDPDVEWMRPSCIPKVEWMRPSCIPPWKKRRHH